MACGLLLALKFQMLFFLKFQMLKIGSIRIDLGQTSDLWYIFDLSGFCCNSSSSVFWISSIVRPKVSERTDAGSNS